jgi:hypothetical protein
MVSIRGRLAGTTWRERIAIVVVALSFLIGLTETRFFPFSDYGMYARAYKDSELLALAWVDSTGETRLVPDELLYPITRLSFYTSFKIFMGTGHSPMEATQWAVKPLRERYGNVRALKVLRVKVKRSPEAEPPYEITKLEPIYEIPL